MNRARVLVGLGAIGALVAAGLAVVAPAAVGARDPLARDAHGTLTVRPGFLGVPAGSSLDNPTVTPGTPVVAAARAHLARYGGAFGAGSADLAERGVARTPAGQDVVRFQQRVAGVPVVGAEAVVSLRPDRELGSALTTLSSATRAATPLVTEAAAAGTARAVAARAAGVPARSLAARSEGRWLLDPRVLGAAAGLGPRTVWRFDVGDGAAVRRLVMVDVRTGGVVMDLDAIEQVDRVVCDSQDVPVTAESDCTSGFARTEGGPASAVTDVNDAFDFGGAVAEFYQEIGGIDLTDALGITIGGQKKLAATVRFCYLSSSCPYANAFWNGHQMYYGDGYASADDVVGHEMTHGVIDQHAELFYWGQSGAINESIADIMGEIVDHRNPGPGDSPTSWGLGEDLPIGAIRDLRNPTLFDQPDRTTSSLYTPDLTYDDNGGVHTDSGVGNKTAYLISQGGSFNGQSIAGIDAGDPGLTKTATLYLTAIFTLSSGSGWADLASVLEQGCQDLAAADVAGFTTADCASVHRATLATTLRTTPTNAPQPADAPQACPAGTTKRVLLDSESGDPATTFDAGPTWNRGVSAAWGSNATSGQESWFSDDPATPGGSALTTAQPILLPAGQQSFLWFQHWRLLDYDSSGAYDGGVVEIDGDDTGSRTWVNGPEDVLSTQFGNPAGGSLAFGGDSFGYVASRLDLTPYAGQAVTPSFVLYSDASIGFIGWFLDDVTVYTCDPGGLANTRRPSIGGKPKVGRTLTARPGSWTPTGLSFAYAWLRNGRAIGGASAKTYRLTRADKGKKIAVRVTATRAGLGSASATSKPVGPIR